MVRVQTAGDEPSVIPTLSAIASASRRRTKIVVPDVDDAFVQVMTGAALDVPLDTERSMTSRLLSLPVVVSAFWRTLSVPNVIPVAVSAWADEAPTSPLTLEVTWIQSAEMSFRSAAPVAE
jgi:hypothetical protein